MESDQQTQNRKISPGTRRIQPKEITGKKLNKADYRKQKETEAFTINRPIYNRTIRRHSDVYLALAMQCKSTAASPFTMCMSAGFTTITGAISAGASPVTINLIKALYSSLPICGLTACALHKHKTLL
jgi:hypothetical protein